MFDHGVIEIEFMLIIRQTKDKGVDEGVCVGGAELGVECEMV